MLFPILIADGIAWQHIAIQLDGFFFADIPLQHIVFAVFQSLQHCFIDKLTLFCMLSHTAMQLHSDASVRALTFVLEARWGRSVLSPVVHAASLCTRFQSACPLCSVQSLSSSVKVCCCLNVSGCQFHFKISHLFFPICLLWLHLFLPRCICNIFFIHNFFIYP